MIAGRRATEERVYSDNLVIVERFKKCFANRGLIVLLCPDFEIFLCL